MTPTFSTTPILRQSFYRILHIVRNEAVIIIKYKALCKKCKKFFLVYPLHSGLCKKCKKTIYKKFNK